MLKISEVKKRVNKKTEKFAEQVAVMVEKHGVLVSNIILTFLMLLTLNSFYNFFSGIEHGYIVFNSFVVLLALLILSILLGWKAKGFAARISKDMDKVKKVYDGILTSYYRDKTELDYFGFSCLFFATPAVIGGLIMVVIGGYVSQLYKPILFSLLSILCIVQGSLITIISSYLLVNNEERTIGDCIAYVLGLYLLYLFGLLFTLFMMDGLITLGFFR